MPYCPECFAEYVEGAAVCMDCGVPLHGGVPPPAPPEKPLKLMRVRVFSGPTALMQADLARNILETQGIPCILPGEQMAETLPGVDVVQVLVRKEDSERAMEILESFWDEAEAAQAAAPPEDDREEPVAPEKPDDAL